jgi:Glycosyltransferase family 10 (fucosyltransferase) C-term
MQVIISGSYNPEFMLRQTPGGHGHWNGLHFRSDVKDGRADWLVVLDEPRPFIETYIPKERRILFVTEPDDCKRYPGSYLRHFGTVISPENLQRYRGRHIRRQPGLPWWIGAGNFFEQKLSSALLYEDIASAPPPEKTRTLSVICSTHNLMAMHRKRMEFVKYIKAYFGDDLHWYGRGVRSMKDKSEAILPYRYHIALENSKIDHFWTEKLADCYLGYTFPIYAGCGNVGEYFPREAFEPIDIDNPEGAIASIKSVLQKDPWQERLGILGEARRRVVDEYNFFNAASLIIHELTAEQPEIAPLRAPEVIYPVPLPFRHKLKNWERHYRRRARAILEKRGLVAPKKNKWKEFAETAVPGENIP